MNSIDVMKCKIVKEAEIEYDAVKTPEGAAGVFKSFGMSDAADEIFAMICLAADGSINAIHEISHGCLTASLVTPRETFKRAFLNNAASIVVAHCHPSHSLKPSSEDIDVTERLKAAGELLGVPLLDHILIAGSKYLSFREEGLL